MSPGILQKMVYAGSHASSFDQASRDVKELSEVDISSARIRRATEKIGTERVAERDEATEQWEALTIPEQQQKPASVALPEVSDVACVEMDGGRLQIWDRDEPQERLKAEEPSAEDVADKSFWRESKVGICLSMTSEVHDVDPCPLVPRTFVDPARMTRLAREIKNATKKSTRSGGPNDSHAKRESEELDAALTTVEEEKRTLRYEAPQIVSRSVVATRQDVSKFGPMLAAMAWSLGFAAAVRKAFVADGSDTNWSVWRRLFSHYTPILDFVHAICYVYQAAMAGLPPDQAWPTYCQWAQWVWSGDVQKAIAALKTRLEELGGPPEKSDTTSPKAKVAETLRYLSNQQYRMKYAEYRCAGLPITSSHIESTIKQINRRVKGTEKFWNSPGAESLLQLTADDLTASQPLRQFWTDREQKVTGQRHYSTAV